MRLHSFTIQKYRSISDAKRIQLGRLNVLVGPNNEGKSNILRALILGMTILTKRRRIIMVDRTAKTYYPQSGYNWRLDFPINLQNKYPQGNTDLIFEFELTESEYAQFSKKVGSKITGLLPIKISLGPARGIHGVKVTYYKKGGGSGTLSKKSELIADFVSKRIKFEYIPAVRNAESAKQIVANLVAEELSLLEENKDYIEAMKKIDQIQQPVLDKISSSINNTLKQFLPEIKKVKIVISKDSEYEYDEKMNAFQKGTEIFVDDGSNTPLSYKGDGVQSLAALGIIRHASERISDGQNFVIALEEPESHLHPYAIHAFREVIEILSKKHQVIITTHNPVFIDRRNISNNIIVKDRKAKPAKDISEIRKLLGVRASDNLRNAELILVVEGSDDEIALKAILERYSTTLRSAISQGTLAFDSLGGGSNLSYKLSLIRSLICRYHVFLDYDNAGRDAYKKANDEGLLEPADVNYAIAKGKDESELEDLYRIELYKNALEKKYNIDLSRSKLNGKSKWSKRMKNIFDGLGKPWDDYIKKDIKNVVARQVQNNPGEALDDRNKGIIDNLVATLEQKLKSENKE